MITAQLASIPERIETLEKTVKSLRPHVNTVYVALNGYKDVPGFLLGDKNIISILMDNVLGDAGKFYDIEKRKGYILTCDDDIIYPPEYVSYMVNKVDEYQCIVSLLGRVYGTRPIKSFRKGYTENYRCLGDVSEDVVVDLGGTGAMAFHTDHVKVTMDDFPKKNMADIWMAKLAHEQGVKIMAVKHRPKFVKYKDYPDRIWIHDDDKYQTEVLNSFLK